MCKNNHFYPNYIENMAKKLPKEHKNGLETSFCKHFKTVFNLSGYSFYCG